MKSMVKQWFSVLLCALILLPQMPAVFAETQETLIPVATFEELDRAFKTVNAAESGSQFVIRIENDLVDESETSTGRVYTLSKTGVEVSVVAFGGSRTITNTSFFVRSKLGPVPVLNIGNNEDDSVLTVDKGAYNEPMLKIGDNSDPTDTYPRGELNLGKGAIFQNNVGDLYAGCMEIRGDGGPGTSKVTIDGAEIRNCQASITPTSCGAILVDGGKLIMNSGKITGCTGGVAAVHIWGSHPSSFRMNGGLISGCRSVGTGTGGAVLMENNSSSVF